MRIRCFVVSLRNHIDQRTEAAHSGGDGVVCLQVREQVPHLCGLACNLTRFEADGVDLAKSAAKGTDVLLEDCRSKAVIRVAQRLKGLEGRHGHLALEEPEFVLPRYHLAVRAEERHLPLWWKRQASDDRRNAAGSLVAGRGEGLVAFDRTTTVKDHSTCREGVHTDS